MFGLLITALAIYAWTLYQMPAETDVIEDGFNRKFFIGNGIIIAIYVVFIFFKRESEWDEERPIARLFFILVTPLTWLYYMLCNIFYGAWALFEAFTPQAPKQHFK